MTDDTLGEIDHTNPYTGQTFGATQTYRRGQTVAADGGAPSEEPEPADEPAADDEERGETIDELDDVDHTPPGNAPSANGAYDRVDGGGQ